MARFSRVDLAKNLNDLVVPLGEYWLAIDTNKYAIGNNNTTFGDLRKYDYLGDIVEVGEIDFLTNPENDIVVDGGNLDGVWKRYVPTEIDGGDLDG